MLEGRAETIEAQVVLGAWRQFAAVLHGSFCCKGLAFSQGNHICILPPRLKVMR